MPQIHLTREKLYRRGGLLDELMDSVFDNAILIDRDCRILHIGTSSFRSPVQRAGLVGQHISVIDAVSPVEEVIRTGQARLDLLLEIGGRKCLSSLFPIVDGSEVIGVLGTITMRSLSRLKKVVSQIGDEASEFAGLYQNLARVERGLTLDDYLGDSPVVSDLVSKAKRAAASDAPILIIGETGTGKEIVASGIHTVRSSGRLAPYVTINCTAIPCDLLESELFGHEKGAFTGATDRKVGKFQLAGDGDILLDEIGDMDLLMQAKLLRVLESREFERVGGHDIIPLRAGIIASTNQNLLRRSEERVFRPDLYYRLSAIELYLPPLRAHSEDIPLLVEHFAAQKGATLRFTTEAMELLKRYPWPGNVRQLKNLVDRWLVFYGGALITATHISDELTIGQFSYNEAFGITTPIPAPALHAPLTLADRESQALRSALEECGGNVTAAAKQLGISRAAFYQKRKRLPG